VTENSPILAEMVYSQATAVSDNPLKTSHFQTTLWSVVTAASRGGGEGRVAALEVLCRTYWYPLYAHVRQRGHGPEDAKDLTQEFFHQLLQKDWLAELEPDPQAGRFRYFLLTALNRFLLNQYDRAMAIKRGGGYGFVSLDQELAEGRFSAEPKTDETPERSFDRRWGLALMDAALGRLRSELSAADKARQFELLSPFLSREPGPGEYSEIAGVLAMSPGSVAVAVHRLRHRYGEVLRAEVAETLANFADLDQEMRHLFAAIIS
jgi:RNA polymerase sigma-70 factor (ECF subfamily)